MGRAGAIAVLACVFGLQASSRAQVEIDNNFKYYSGQDVQPIFDGWSHADDGGFLMHFGYLNRNWVQELSVPVGPNNNVEPNGPDRGQPAFFYTRTNRNQFSVKVPKDWGLKREVVWTVTANGKTQKAIGWLQPEWEIATPNPTTPPKSANAEAQKNKAPTLTLAPTASGAVSAPVTISATVADDGLPKPAAGRGGRRGGPAIGQETPPILRGGVTDVPNNVPALGGAGGGGGGGGRGAAGAGQGPTVSWTLWRGPANATFSTRSAPVKDGQAQITVTFSKPGEYVLRARASDRALSSTPADIRVTVR
jgi:hypothetical protein